VRTVKLSTKDLREIVVYEQRMSPKKLPSHFSPCSSISNSPLVHS
jgi:hypothetical protein